MYSHICIYMDFVILPKVLRYIHIDIYLYIYIYMDCVTLPKVLRFLQIVMSELFGNGPIHNKGCTKMTLLFKP